MLMTLASHVRRSSAAKPSKPQKKKKQDSDDDDESDYGGDGEAVAPSRQSSGRRASAGAGKKYVEEDSYDSMS